MAIICEKFNWLLFVKNSSTGYYCWKIVQMAIIAIQNLWKIVQMAIIVEK